MTLRELLIERQAALCGRWLDAILAEYGPLTASRWRRERDPFANPIGHALVTGLPELLAAVRDGGEPSAGAVTALEDIVRIRSVQQLAPSRAVGFVYKLRDAIRAELEPELAGGAHAAEREEVDAGIERLALRAFDTYVGFREQILRLRQRELERSVASILRRWHGDELPEPPPEVVQLGAPRERATGGDG
jgi:hypothetical protein